MGDFLSYPVPDAGFVVGPSGAVSSAPAFPSGSLRLSRPDELICAAGYGANVDSRQRPSFASMYYSFLRQLIFIIPLILRYPRSSATATTTTWPRRNSEIALRGRGGGANMAFSTNARGGRRLCLARYSVSSCLGYWVNVTTCWECLDGRTGTVRGVRGPRGRRRYPTISYTLSYAQ